MAENTNLALASTNKRQKMLYEIFDEYLNSLTKISYRTIYYYVRDFKNIVEDKYIADVNVNDIQKYINYKYDTQLKDTTIYKCYCILKTVFNYAIAHEYIIKNPCIRCQSKICFTL